MNLTDPPARTDDSLADSEVSDGAHAPARPPLSEQDWKALVKRYEGALRYSLRRRVALSSDADDLVQQALLLAVQSWSAYRGEAAVSTWVFGIAHNLARHHVSRGPGLVQWGTGDTVDMAPCSTPGPCELLAQREMVQCLQDGLSTLTATQAEAVWLVGVEGLSYEEAAAAMGASVSAVKHRVARARTRLRTGWK